MYDLTKVKRDPNTGFVLTGQYGQINPEYLGEAGYKQALAYANPEFQRGLEEKKPVTILSTDRAAETVDRNLGSLNGLSPSTSPGYTPPPTTPVEKTTIPKAYFANEAGQEAEYTEVQLNDPATRKFIQENGYVMTKTEGPTVQASEVKGVNDRMSGLIDTITNYNVDSDPGFVAQANSIKEQYGRLRTDMEKANKQRAGTIATMGIRGGTSRYAGGVEMGIEGEELRQAAGRIADINAREASAISAARTAYRTGKFSEFNTQVTALENLRTSKQKELETVNKTLADARKKFEETTMRASRDSAVAGIVAQGITDATQILGYLNFDEQGKQVGDFTAKEVGDALKNISPGAELKNLTGTVKEFYSLLGQGALPETITSLPEEDQFFAYLTLKKQAAGTGKNGSDNVITRSEADAWGLPKAVVGSSEKEVMDSLRVSKPPAWFMEKLIIEQGNDDYAETRWNEYRNKILYSTDKKKGSNDTTDLSDEDFIKLLNGGK